MFILLELKKIKIYNTIAWNLFYLTSQTDTKTYIFITPNLADCVFMQSIKSGRINIKIHFYLIRGLLRK